MVVVLLVEQVVPWSALPANAATLSARRDASSSVMKRVDVSDRDSVLDAAWRALRRFTIQPTGVAPTPGPPIATVNRTVPAVTPRWSRLTFSVLPTNAEIFRARVFSEPLVPVGRATVATDNVALAEALRGYAASTRPEDVASITRFLESYRDSPWRASLLVNLGEIYDRVGYGRRALEVWHQAWMLTKDATDLRGRAVADRALAEWLDLAFERGDVDGARQLLRKTVSREISGSAEAKVRNVRERLSILTYQRHLLVPVEQQALARLAAYERKTRGPSSKMTDMSAQVSDQHVARGRRQAPAARRSWASTLRLASRFRLSLRPGVREPKGRLLPRSLVHLRTGHVVAVLEAQADRLLVYDPLRGDDRWIAADALEEEASGAALIVAGPLPNGWEAATTATAAVFVIQMCPPGPPNDNDPPPCNCGGGAGGSPGGGAGGGGGGGNGGGGSGGNSPEPGEDNEPSGECGSGPCETGAHVLARYRLHRLTAGLLIEGSPVGNRSPRGPGVFFHVRYNQRAGFFPQILNFSNLGSKWTHDWLSYVEDLPVACGGGGAGGNCIPAHARVVPRGGGFERHIPSGSMTYHRHWRSASELVRISNAPLRFERRLRDGSVEVFAEWDGVPTGQGARVFLSEIIDPHGQSVQLAYDGQFRLVSITDAVGQVTTIAYELATDPLKITKVTDPFGRFATFTYTTTGQLASITGVTGLTSSFAYFGDFLTRLTTPYGATTFRKETDWQNDAFVRHVEAIDPLGNIERVEYRTELPTLLDSVPASEVPTGFDDFNGALDQFVSLYWNKRAMALAPRDPASAVIASWLTENLFNKQWVGVNVPRYVSRPLEGRVWYAYPGQDPFDGEVGAWIQPSKVARILDDGTSQIWQTTYNARGNVTSETDPLGRRTSYAYAANDLDVLEVRQTTGTQNDLLVAYANYTSLHRPQTITDAAGQTTTLTYNAHGQLTTATDALSQITTYSYNANGSLQSKTGPVSGATTQYVYDTLGRLTSIVGADGYATVIEYDTLDRPTRETFPDGSNEERTYHNLDLVESRDRLGRVTRRTYDAVGRLVAVRDPLGRTFTQRWCDCGSLDAIIDGAGQSTAWIRDLRGRVISEVRADGATTIVYEYENTTNRVKRMTDPKQQVTHLTYNLDDAVASITHTQAEHTTPSVSYVYDPIYRRVTAMTDGTGTTTYTYHAPGSLGALLRATVDGPLTNDTLSYTYDVLGRMASVTMNGGTLIPEITSVDDNLHA